MQRTGEGEEEGHAEWRFWVYQIDTLNAFIRSKLRNWRGELCTVCRMGEDERNEARTFWAPDVCAI